MLNQSESSGISSCPYPRQIPFKKVREDLRKYHENKIETVIELNRGIKCLRPTLGRPSILSVRDQQGVEQRNSKAILRTVETFYTDLYNSQIDPGNEIKATIRN